MATVADPGGRFFILSERFLLGDRIDLKEVEQIAHVDDFLACALTEILAGSAMIQVLSVIRNKLIMKEGKKVEGLERLKAGIVRSTTLMGAAADLCFCPFLLEGYLSCGLIEEGLHVVEYFLQKHRAIKVETICGSCCKYTGLIIPRYRRSLST